jgi:hypothetical protein
MTEGVGQMLSNPKKSFGKKIGEGSLENIKKLTDYRSALRYLPTRGKF